MRMLVDDVNELLIAVDAEIEYECDLHLRVHPELSFARVTRAWGPLATSSSPMSRRRRRAPLLSIAAVAAGILLLGACGGDDDDDDSSTSSSTGAPEITTAPTSEIDPRRR